MADNPKKKGRDRELVSEQEHESPNENGEGVAAEGAGSDSRSGAEPREGDGVSREEIAGQNRCAQK
nr:hypothetical protein [Sinorhizobium medicae]